MSRVANGAENETKQPENLLNLIASKELERPDRLILFRKYCANRNFFDISYVEALVKLQSSHLNLKRFCPARLQLLFVLHLSMLCQENKY